MGKLRGTLLQAGVVSHVSHGAKGKIGKGNISLPLTQQQTADRLGITPVHLWLFNDWINISSQWQTTNEIDSGRNLYEVVAVEPLQPSFDGTKEIRILGGSSRLAAKSNNAFMEDLGGDNIWFLLEGYFPTGAGGQGWMISKYDAGGGTWGYAFQRSTTDQLYLTTKDNTATLTRQITISEWITPGRAIIAFGHSKDNNINFIVVRVANKIYSVTGDISTLGTMTNDAYFATALQSPALECSLNWMAGFTSPVTLEEVKRAVRKLI